MMLFRKGSLPEQLVVRAPLDLIVTLDDARSGLYSIFLVEEGAPPPRTFVVWARFSRHGLIDQGDARSPLPTVIGPTRFFHPRSPKKAVLLTSIATTEAIPVQWRPQESVWR